MHLSVICPAILCVAFSERIPDNRTVQTRTNFFMRILINYLFGRTYNSALVV